MKIERIVNGKKTEIELTENELCLAYREQQHLFDMEDVRSYVENIDWDDDDRPPEMTEDQIDEAAFWVREWLDESDTIGDVRWDCIREAIEKVMKDEN